MIEKKFLPRKLVCYEKPDFLKSDIVFDTHNFFSTIDINAILSNLVCQHPYQNSGGDLMSLSLVFHILLEFKVDLTLILRYNGF